MKHILFFTLLTFLGAETMSPMEHQSLHTYNKRPTLRHSGDTHAHKLHKIDENEAKKIAVKHCKEKNISLKLTHQGRMLYYIATTAKCILYINALDGSVIVPEKFNTKVK